MERGRHCRRLGSVAADADVMTWRPGNLRRQTAPRYRLRGRPQRGSAGAAGLVGSTARDLRADAGHAEPIVGRSSSAGRPLHWCSAAHEALPIRSRSVDVIVAHGVWNLAPPWRSPGARCARLREWKGRASCRLHVLAGDVGDAAPVEGESSPHSSSAHPSALNAGQPIEELGARAGSGRTPRRQSPS